MSKEEPRIRWFTPDKPENISVGRQRIATHLRDDGFSVDVTGTTLQTVRDAFRERDAFDVVIGTTRAGAFASTAVGRTTGKPVIVDHVDPIAQFRETHSLPFAIPVQLAEDLTFTLASTVLFVYEQERARVSRYTTESVKTDLGVDYDRFADPDPEVIRTSQDYLEAIPLRENVAIYVGGLECIYHPMELIAAMSHLPDWSLLLVGDGRLRASVEDAASRQDNIHYLGTVSHQVIPGYLRAADVGISLVDDPHTLKVLEYGAAGIPVVQVAGLAEERFGNMVEYADLTPESIANAIKRAGDRELSGTFQSYVADFDWRDIADDYAAAIDGVT